MSVKESDIIKQLADPAAQQTGFALLVRQYSEPLYWKIRHFVLTHEDADDVLQNTFLKAWLNLDKFKGDSKISTWLFRIAINESLDFLRRQKAAQRSGFEGDLSLAERLVADDYFDGNEAQALLQEAIAQLPEVQRAVFNLRYFDDMKYTEISELLGTSVGALKSSYHIAAQKVAEYLRSKD